jgi:hypothetical protein
MLNAQYDFARATFGVHHAHEFEVYEILQELVLVLDDERTLISLDGTKILKGLHRLNIRL